MSNESEKCLLQVKELDSEETTEISKYFTENLLDGFVRVGPKGYWFTKGITEVAPKIYNMSLRHDDTWVITFMKSGTTFIQELVWLLANDCDFAKAETIPQVARFPFLEYKLDSTTNMLAESYEYVSELRSPRFIKSHLPLSMLPPTLLDICKVVYVARDPRDVLVSYYHHTRLFKILGYTGDLKQYWNLFIQNKLDYTPYFDSVKEVWEKRNHQNLLFLFYEDAIKDLPSTVKKVTGFLGKTVTDQQLIRLCDYLSIKRFKDNKSVNFHFITQQIHSGDKNVYPFIREGKAGGWRENFDEEMTRQAEQWMADNLRDTDLRYPN